MLIFTVSARQIKFILLMSYLVSCISKAVTATTTSATVNPQRELIFFCLFCYSHKNTLILHLETEFN